MSFVETESHSGVHVIRLNRPERLNALGQQMISEFRAALEAFGASDHDVGVVTGTGRAFCVGEDLKETAERGVPDDPRFHGHDPYGILAIDKPLIAAVNGFAMGGGFMLVADCDLRVSVPDAIYEASEVKRWHLGGFSHGHAANLPLALTTELAFGFRVDARRLHHAGFLNRLAEPDRLLDSALDMAHQLLRLPPAARQNTVRMVRAMRPRVPPRLERFADRLREHGAAADLVESRRAFVEKREPAYIGWDDPEDRRRGPVLEHED